MQSKNKKSPTAVEQAHIWRVQALRCSVCGQPGPSEVHEIKQGQWFSAVALCPDCHRGSINGLHGQRRMWAIYKLDEVDALAITIERLMSPTACPAPNAERYNQEDSMATRKMTEKQDAKIDKRDGIKEDSKKDKAQDGKAGVMPKVNPYGKKK